jgi:HEAT repeat protein/predicted MFS family arabinose efflux permease
MTTYHPPTTAEKLRALPWALGANASNAVFVQLVFFGPAFVLFLDELSISRTEIGFLLSLVPFTGLVALFIAPTVARFGYKRTFLIFWGTRKIIAAFLLFVPFVSMTFGLQAALILITLIMVGFSLCRSIAETGYYPWVQEYVPDSVRGKFSATNTALANLVGIIATAVATFVIGLSDDINRFMILFALGVTFGLISVVMYSRIPGGASVAADDKASNISYRDLFTTIKDINLRYYLAGILFFTFGTGPLYSFLPLFMRQEVGLTESHILSLQISILVGGLISSQLLGWSADRYGSKPVMLSGVVLTIFLPIGWILLPRMTNVSLPLALTLAFFQGVSVLAWAVGSSRLLFTQVVPKDKKSQYMAVYYAIIGLIGGVSKFIGGVIIDAFSGLSGQFLFIQLDSFTVLMVMSIILPAISLLLFRYVKSESRMGVTQFAGMFIHGNPVFALSTMARFYRAKDVTQAVLLTERLGQTNSPLTVDEMISALTDPRFYVRFEAVISISRMTPNPQLTKALINLLRGTEISLSVMAAWALGRIGDETALPALRKGLELNYRSIKAHSARALGAMGDHQIIPKLHERLKSEDDVGLRIAYAATLATLGATPAIPTLFEVLNQTRNDKARMEIVLSMAKMVSGESHFVALLRGMQSDAGTMIAQELMRLQTRLGKNTVAKKELVEACLRATEAFGTDNMEKGIDILIIIIEGILFLTENLVAQKLLQGSLDGLKQWGMQHPENILLALNILNEEMLFTTGEFE